MKCFQIFIWLSLKTADQKITQKENMMVDPSPRFLDIILIVPNRMISTNGRQLKKKKNNK